MLTKTYPIINELIKRQRIQPLYTEFFIEHENYKLPIKINNTGSEIFQLCDGNHTIDSIIEYLSIKYNESNDKTESVVVEFLNQAQRYNHLHFLDKSSDTTRKIVQVGSRNYWTPELIAVELTHNCPLKCKHCYLNAGTGVNINPNTVIRLLDECVDMEIDNVQFTGGEPMVHPHFFNLLDEAMKRGITVNLYTSGYINNDNILRELKRYSNSSKLVVQVSIDGLEKTHDDFRGMKGSFEKSMDFVKKVIDLGIKTSIGTCISNQSYEEIRTLSERLKQVGVYVHRLSPISDRGRAAENLGRSSSEKVLSTRKMIKQLSEEFNTNTFRVFYYEDGDGFIDYRYKHNCGLGQTVLKIDPEGNVYPCLMSDIKYANICDKSLLEIQKLYSRKWEKIYSPSVKLCNNCKDLGLCNNCVNEGILYCNIDQCEFKKQYTQLCKDISL